MPRPNPDQPVAAPTNGAPDAGSKPEGGFMRGKDEAQMSFSALYEQLDSHCKTASTPMSMNGLRSMIGASGISEADPRIAHTMAKVKESGKEGDEHLTLDEFTALIRPNLRMMLRILNQQLVIPDFHGFTNDLTALYHFVEGDHSGANADYIPILRDADPDRWGVSVCSTDGQRFIIGDVDDYFSIQSTSKVVTFAMALSEVGEKETLSYVGVEPSGQAFNAIVCLPDHRPHNPCVNVGAIMTCAVLASASPDRTPAEHTKHVMSKWAALSGHTDEIKFSEETMQSEKGTGFNNYSLCYFAKARRGLPEDADVNDIMDFYLSNCSIQATCKIMAAVAGSLANGGVCPMTGEQVFTSDVVRRTLAVMQSCGMYDASGQFLYQIGLPAKSGVSGIVISVVPNVMGLAAFSPRLDKFGNSVRGVRFNQLLTECFSFHSYDNLSAFNSGCKKDPRLSHSKERDNELRNLRFAVQHGDIVAVKFRHLLLQAMMATAMADDQLADEETAALREVYGEVMRCSLDAAELAQVSEEMHSAGVQGFMSSLKAASQELDDIQRDMLIEATFKVAAADGIMKSQEIDVLAQVASALGIPAIIIELRVFEYREELASRGRSINRPSSQVVRVVSGELHAATDSTDVAIERLAIEEGLDAPDGRHSELHAADAVSRTEIQPTSGANRGAGPPSTGKSGR